jgi:hypothetical protein
METLDFLRVVAYASLATFVVNFTESPSLSPNLIKVSILKATYREPARSAGGEHAGKAATEAEVASIRAANCITPIAAAGTDKVERTSAAAVEARHGQFKGRCKSTNA